MTNKSGACWQYSCRVNNESLLEFETVFDEVFEVFSINKIEEENSWEIIAYSQNEIDSNFLNSLISDKAKELDVNKPVVDKKYLQSDNWLKENVISFPPVEIDEFYIYGTHITEIPKDKEIKLQINAATAFGSGEHQTTKGCLHAISLLNKKGRKFNKILDMGCGSGILSLAAAKIWNEAEIFAVDIDPDSVLVTNENAVQNGIEKNFYCEGSDGYKSDFVKSNGKYDLIIANILARPLIDMAEDLVNHLNDNGVCILSGLITEQEDWVINAHKKEGLKLREIYRFDNWTAILMVKA
jgi:ribosomal protein L11 methyltransferase